MTRLLLLLPLALLFAGCTPPLAIGEPALGEDARGVSDGSAISADILDLVQQHREAAGYPGLAISVRRSGAIVLEAGFGTADLEQGTPVTPQSVFQIGSLTKSFTSVLIARLAEEGLVALDDPVSAYLPGFDGPAASVPVRYLMNHTSGLLNYTDHPELEPGTRDDLSREDLVALFEDEPLLFEPGTAFSYSNSGTYLLGLIAEAVTGQSYEEALDAWVIDPLGLQNTEYGDWRTVVRGRVQGYVPTEGGILNAPVLDPEIPFAAGALLSTVEDVQRYLDLVHRQNVFGDGVRDVLLERQPLADGTSLDYALGALVIRDWEGHRKIAHAGDIDGFSAYMAFYPEDDISIVVLANARNLVPTAVGLEQKIARLVFGAPRPPLSGEPLRDEETEALQGTYHEGPVRIGLGEVTIIPAGDGIAAELGPPGAGGPVVPLLHVEGRRFVAAHDDEMEVVFTPETGAAETLLLRWLGAEIPLARRSL